ncbi:MAG: matrixin family metalloprotease, partial [Planctomycetes bacterium]|nr:matrixin family metalloprotease [Planctomycetota bacterium]
MRFALPALCLTFAALAALIASQSQSHAYSSIKVFDNGEAGFGREVRWEMAATRTNQANGRILYRIGVNGTADTLTGPFNEFAAIQKAFSVWASIDGLDLDFEFAGTTSNPAEDGNDDVNTIYWATGGFGPGELAVTTTTFDVTNGQILDADLAFNDDYVWDTYAENVTVGSAGRSAIRQTAVHEIGHFLGLDHSFLGRATLFPFTDAGAISGISLAHDDISGLYAAHADPSALTPNQNGSVSGTVTLSGTGRLGVQVTLIDTATGRPIVSALSDRATPVSTAGAYRIENVPAGNYWVVASPILTTDIGFYYSQAETLTDFSPTILGVAADMSGAPTILSVGQNEDLAGIDFALTAAAGFFEANDTVATASAIAVGDALGARIESTSDLDHYRFNAQQGETVSIRVHADGMGSDLNPFLVLY